MGGGDFFLLPECPAPASDVDDEISGVSLPSASSRSSSSFRHFPGRGVEGSGELLATDDDVVVVSTNFSVIGRFIG